MIGLWLHRLNFLFLLFNRSFISEYRLFLRIYLWLSCCFYLFFRFNFSLGLSQGCKEITKLFTIFVFILLYNFLFCFNLFVRFIVLNGYIFHRYFTDLWFTIDTISNFRNISIFNIKPTIKFTIIGLNIKIIPNIF